MDKVQTSRPHRSPAELGRYTPWLVMCIFMTATFMSPSAEADSFYTLIGYKCNVQTDRLIIYHVGRWNDLGEKMFLGRSKNEWAPGLLVNIDEKTGRFGDSLKTSVTTCALAPRGGRECALRQL
jgi:hypothetical protein